jgi:hypothetical protein
MHCRCKYIFLGLTGRCRLPSLMAELKVVIGQGNYLMKRIMSAALVCLFASASVVSAAQSVAVVQGASGKVLVNKGKGFSPVVGDVQLNAGDRILVGEDSFATISYADCAVSLAKPTVFTVAKAAPCVEGQKSAMIDGVMVSPVADLPDPVAAALPWPALLLIGGAAAVVTVIVLDKKGPASNP